MRGSTTRRRCESLVALVLVTALGCGGSFEPDSDTAAPELLGPALSEPEAAELERQEGGRQTAISQSPRLYWDLGPGPYPRLTLFGVTSETVGYTYSYRRRKWYGPVRIMANNSGYSPSAAINSATGRRERAWRFTWGTGPNPFHRSGRWKFMWRHPNRLQLADIDCTYHCVYRPRGQDTNALRWSLQGSYFPRIRLFGVTAATKGYTYSHTQRRWYGPTRITSTRSGWKRGTDYDPHTGLRRTSWSFNIPRSFRETGRWQFKWTKPGAATKRLRYIWCPGVCFFDPL